MPSRKCEHTAWLQLVHGKAQQKLLYDDRLHTLAKSLTEPHQQTPRVAVFLGHKAKDECLKQIFPQNPIKRPRKVGDSILSIRCDGRTLASTSPLYFADVDPNYSSCGLELGKTHCHPQQAHPISWSNPVKGRFLDFALARLVFPFSDVVCMFASDCGGFRGLVGLISTWTGAGQGSHGPIAVKPRLLVVADHEDPDFAIAAARRLREAVERETKSEHVFASIQVVNVQCGSPAVTRYAEVQAKVLSNLEKAIDERGKTTMLFTANHQRALFQAAVVHFSSTISRPFDFVRAARQYGLDSTPSRARGDSEEQTKHVENVLTMARGRVTQRVITSVLASSMLLDAKPPGMHIFNAEILVQTIYRAEYLHAFSRVSVSAVEAQQSCQDVMQEFCRLYNQSDGSAMAVHLNTLRANATQWSPLRSNTTCLCCDRGGPEHPIPCGHALCETCLKTFGRNASGDRDCGVADLWYLANCPICNMQISFYVRVKPPTAGFSLISFDGGGVKGAIPLEYLILLQQDIGDCPIQELFDLAFGTSVGGLIALNLFLQQLTVEMSSCIFKTLSNNIFKRADSLFERIYRFGIQDSLYDSNLLQSALIQQFGPLPRMFDCHELLASKSGTKLAVIACSKKDNTARVFATYNGERTRHADCGYKLERPNDPNQEPHVWQAARATSAAPGLFSTMHIPFLDVYQDGALKHNNPIKIALWESRHIWPSAPRPDVVLSLGTGHRTVTYSPVLTTPKFSFTDIAPGRVFRAWMSSIDGQSEWRELMNSLPEEEAQNFFRLTVEFAGAEPRVDDVSAMEDMVSMVRSQYRGSEQSSKIIMALLISRFYFELDTLPSFDGAGFYQSYGRIRCRSSSVVRSLLKIYDCPIEFFEGPKSLNKLVSVEDLCRDCGRYFLPVELHVRSLDEPISISLRWGMDHERRISAMPHPISWFVGMQGLDSPFGTSTHRSTRSTCLTCDPTEQRVAGKMKRTRSEDAKEAFSREAKRHRAK